LLCHDRADKAPAVPAIIAKLVGMPKRNARRRSGYTGQVWIWGFLLFGVLLVLPSPIDAQTPPRDEGNRDPRLRIDSPRDGAVVASGETLQVAVSSPNRTRFVLGITVVMTTDSIDNQEATSLPTHFAIKIPKSIRPGLYGVSAVAGRAGRAGSDGELVVAGIEVDIERREMPRAITPRVPQIYFEKKGETREIELVGDFGIGDFVDVTQSSRVTFEASDTAVATVDKSGTVTAVGAGHAAGRGVVRSARQRHQGQHPGRSTVKEPSSACQP
jgi:hypothetical protein